MFDEDAKSKSALYAAILLTALGYTGRYFSIEPIHNQFFIFAVWAFILFIDNISYRLKGTSLLISRTDEFCILAFWSLIISAVFEIINLRLGAWYYTNQPSDLSTRWGSWCLQWSALLPCFFISEEALSALGLFRGIKAKPLPVTASLVKFLYAAGGGMLLLAMAAPLLFGPLVWPAFLFLAEPVNYRFGLQSLLRELEGGLPGKTLRLAASGVSCGLLWALWNSGAGAKWGYYTQYKAEEIIVLPLPAYLAFSVAALTMYSLYNLASLLRAGRTWEERSWTIPGRQPGLIPQGLAVLLACFTLYAALRLVDAHSVKMYLGWL